MEPAHGADDLPAEPYAGRSASAARHDLWLVIALTVLTFVLSAAFELHEFFARLTLPFEFWQLDEVPVAAAVLGLGLAWSAIRARRAAVAELRARIDAERESRRLLAHNRELSRQLLALQESERRALARELHDELGARCSAIRVEAACMQHASDGAEMAAAAARTAATADALYASVRSLLRRLRPAELDELGLLAALQALCESWEARSGVACVLHHDDGLPSRPADVVPFASLGEALATALYRVTQEALTNVMRHAAATRVRIVLKRGAQGDIHLRIADDGGGFDATRQTRGLGLLGAAERAAALGGRLHVKSAPGEGCRLELMVPGPPPAAAPTEPAAVPLAATRPAAAMPSASASASAPTTIASPAAR